MSTSKIPPLQPGPARKKKRKYTNWDKQFYNITDGQPLRRASRRASMLVASMRAANASKKNDAISSDATLHVPLPACASSQQSHVPLPACASSQSSRVPLPACASSQQSHVPLPACTSSQSSHVPLPACASSQSSHVPLPACASSQPSHVTLPACASSQPSQVPLPACASSQQSHVPLPACESSQPSHVPLLACTSSQQSHVPFPACASSQSSRVPLPACVSSQQSHVTLTACPSSQQSHVPLPACASSQSSRVPLPACASSQQSHVPLTACGQQSHVPLPACASSQPSHVPLPACPSSQQSHVTLPACPSSQQSHVTLPACVSIQPSHVPLPACASSQPSHVPLPACPSSQQSQTPINSSSYLHFGDCNLVCEYCGSYFWHGERVISFSTKRQTKYIRCCKGARATSDTLAEESCSGSTHTKQRLCSGQGSGEIVQESGTKDKIKSGSSKLADEVSTEIHDHILPYVNKLHDHRNIGQNAVFFDGQDRLVKVVSFVSSLLDDTRNPILIIASSSALSLWEIEFSKWSKSINVVTYKEPNDIQASIRGSKSQVLLSSPDAIVEDMETFDRIKWELLVIDGCQCPVISMHLTKMQMLVADMKLLIVSGEPMDILQSYRNILSLLDCKTEKIENDCDTEMNNDISTLKERLSPFIAFECKLRLSTPDLEEYWVPVHLSPMQIKQYCSILSLSSLSRTPSLNDVITQIQKCCDHPYLMDPTLRNSPKEPSLIDPSAAEINVSGKLHVFDKLLFEIKRCGLRALVLFHSAVNSEKISTGHFLENLVHQRFGENSYVYIPGWILSRSALVKKTESLEMFNKADSDRFICLCDHLACLSSLRLSHVDVVILFNSGRNPSNDIKALKRITIDSHCERLKVFRLYSAFTVEEKALILSKQGTPVESPISRSVCHQLLAWGATYLFSKLQSSTNAGPQSFIDDLVQELSSVLRNTSVETGPTNRSIISNARMQDGAYSGSISLFGETETHTNESSSIDEYFIRHTVLWSNLVKQSQPVPGKSCSSSSSSDTPAEESFSGFMHKKESLCFGQGSGENVQLSGKKDKIEFGGNELVDIQFEVSTEIHNHVNKLRDHWNRGQNAVFFDGQGRLAKVASFVSSLRENMKKPILIIASSSALLLWEMEFITWSKSINVVTYRGTKDIRAAIRGSEFKVLLSSPDAIVEDMETLDHIKWELLVIDECQCHAISTHLEKFQMLMADMKLLTVSGEPVDILQSYRNILSLVDCKNVKIQSDADMEMNDDISTLKERLSPFIAFECNLKRTEKETSSVKVLQIPASEMVRSKSPYLTSGLTTCLPGHSLAGSGLRLPAPHLRSSPSMFASFRNQPASGEPSLEPLPSSPATQTVDKYSPV